MKFKKGGENDKMTELEDIYNNMQGVLRSHFFDNRLFPSATFLKDDLEKRERFEWHKRRLERKFAIGSDEYKAGVLYLTKLFGIWEEA